MSRYLSGFPSAANVGRKRVKGSSGPAPITGPAPPPPSVVYLLNAPFTADNQSFSDAQVLDTEAEGITTGELTVADAGAGSVAVVSNKAVVTKGGGYDTGFYSETYSRVIGLGVYFKWNVATGNTGRFVLGTCEDAGVGATSWITGGGFTLDETEVTQLLTDDGGSSVRNTGVYAANTDYELFTVLGGYNSSGVPYQDGDTKTDFKYGAAQMIKGGAYTDWTLLYRITVGNDASIRAVSSINNAGGNEPLTVDLCKIPDPANGGDLTAVLEPLMLDTFTDTDAVELAAHSPDVGAFTWVEAQGDWEIASNKASLNGDSGADEQGNAIVDTGVADVVLEVTANLAVGDNAGLRIRRSSATQSWALLADDANKFSLYEYDSVFTERATVGVAIAPTTDYRIIAVADAQTITGWLDDANRITYASAALNETETKHGIYGTLDATTLDNFAVYPRTSATYTSILDGV